MTCTAAEVQYAANGCATQLAETGTPFWTEQLALAMVLLFSGLLVKIILGRNA